MSGIWRLLNTVSLISIRKKHCLSVLLILLLAMPVQIYAKQRESFIEPEVCGKCHDEIYKQWKGSMHSSAFKDPVWQAVSKLFLDQATTPENIYAAQTCVKCHLAGAYILNKIQFSAHGYEANSKVAENGVFCDFCHSVKGSHGTGNGAYIIDEEVNDKGVSTKYGPFKDSKTDAHPSSYSDLHTKSEFCGMCHDVFHNANLTPIEATYTEWKNSPYNTGDPKTSTHCQDCHMRQRPGIPSTGSTPRTDNPGKAAKDGPERPHIYTHYFVGGNISVTSLLGGNVHAKMAEERLQNAAKVEITNDPSDSWLRGDVGKVYVKVENIGAGHYLPTGITEIRQVWLAVTVTDNKGNLIFESGGLDTDKNIDKDSVFYNTILGDAQGNPTTNVTLATHVMYDYRIPPKGYATEKYYFKIPEDAASPLAVKVTLKYRSASQKLINDLLKDKAPTLAIVDMADNERQVNVK
jgi:hypothetical protein